MDAPFTYFFPECAEVPAAYADRFERGKISICELAKGPDDSRGLLIAPYSQVLCKVDKNTQTWERIDENVWLGNAKKIKPEIFLRSKTFDSYKVKLADGNEWLIPIANPYIKSCKLPIIYRWRWCPLACKKQLYYAVEEAYQKVSEKAGEIGISIYNKLVKNETSIDFEMSDEEAAEFLHEVISINYNINFIELQSLGVFSADSFQKMFSALIDLPEIEKLVQEEYFTARENMILSKKNFKIDNGEWVKTPIINQPLPT